MKINVVIETGSDKRFEAVIDPNKDYGLPFGLLGEGYTVEECIEKNTGINQRQLSHYLNGVKKPRQRTIQKIEISIHRFANELSQVNFVQ